MTKQTADFLKGVSKGGPGKGSRQRPHDKELFDKEWQRIFGKGKKQKRKNEKLHDKVDGEQTAGRD